MTIAWFFAPYKRRTGTPHPTRYCALDDFTAQVRTDGGDWSETEVLGGWALVKVSAKDATLATIAGTLNFLRIPNHSVLTDSLSDLTALQKTAITTQLTTMGYLAAEITAALGADLGANTLGQLLNFAATRRLRPRYVLATDTIILDGPSDPVRPVSNVDGAVTVVVVG